MAKKGVAGPQPPKTAAQMPALTARQREIFEYLRELIVARGYGPTVREIAQHFGITSPNGVTGHLKALEKKGLISRESYMSRAIQLTDAPQPQASLPLAGHLQIGAPLQLQPDPLTWLEFAGLFSSPAHCCLRVTGSGLVDDGIAEGDYIVVRRQPDCRDGELVLGIVDDGSAVVKRYYRESRQIRLESINRSKPPAFTKRLKVVGIIAGVIRQF